MYLCCYAHSCLVVDNDKDFKFRLELCDQACILGTHSGFLLSRLFLILFGIIHIIFKLSVSCHCTLVQTYLYLQAILPRWHSCRLPRKLSPKTYSFAGKCLNYQILGLGGYNEKRTSWLGVPSAILEGHLSLTSPPELGRSPHEGSHVLFLNLFGIIHIRFKLSISWHQ